MKKITSILAVLLSLLMISSVMIIGVGASSAYQTYTYDIHGGALYSPDAYSAFKSIGYTDMGMEENFNNPTDMTTDNDKKVYIADKGNNRVVVLDRYYKFDFEIAEFVNEQGNRDQLKSPEGVFVSDEHIWVCDTLNDRLVRFTKTGEFDKIFSKPESPLIDNDGYRPRAMAVDQYGRIYVVSQETEKGIIVMDSNGEFVGFIGAQKVTISLWDIIWKRFQTDEQKMLSENTTAPTYNNITISDEGFIYVTIALDEEYEDAMEADIRAKAKDGDNMPVKLLNPAGEEIMRRNGFWPPAGEIDYSSDPNDKYTGVSLVTDVAVGPENTWTIIDEKRNKLYTYDFNGNLLFAFGDTGLMLGSISTIGAISYQGDKMLVLDKGLNTIVIYEPTEYGRLLIQAIAAENALDYTYAIECWEMVLQRNCNFDAAYVGIGNALYRGGDYEESLEYFETAYDTENWSNSYKEVRKEWMADWFILMLVAIIAVLVAVVKFFAFAAKVNKRVSVDGKARKTFGQELIYGFYTIFHPFDGYYDLKHEHRGSVRASLVFLFATVVAFYYQGVGQGYVLNPTGVTSSIFVQIISVLVPFFLFVLSNWCLTTLFEGEGSFKDIFISTSYSLLPLPMLIIPATIASNWVAANEASLITFVGTLAFIWAGFLIFFGTMVTHDYSMGKNVITVLGTILGMACIIFVVLLFSMLLSKLVALVSNIVTEIQYRV